jgi:membrane associated rhomboid family serine protease
MGQYQSYAYAAFFPPLSPLVVVLTPTEIFEREFMKREILAYNWYYQFWNISTLIVFLLLLLYFILYNYYYYYYYKYHFWYFQLDCYYIVYYRQWWRLITSVIVFTSFFHLLFLGLVQVIND